MSLRERLEQLGITASGEVASANSAEGLREVDVRFLGRKGELTELLPLARPESSYFILKRPATAGAKSEG